VTDPAAVTIIVQTDPMPRPVAAYAEMWGKTIEAINRWCRDGKVPGAFRGPDGAWWVKPLLLWNWTPSEVDDEEREGSRDGGPDREGLVRQETDKWQRHLRPGQG